MENPVANGSAEPADPKTTSQVSDPETSKKSELREYYEQQMKNTIRRAEEREQNLRRDFSQKLDLIEKKYNELREQYDDNLLAERNELKQALRSEYERQLEALREENDSLENEVQSLRKKLHTLLQGASTSSNNICDLANGSVSPAAQNGGEMKSNLLKRISQLKQELDARDKTVSEQAQQVNSLISKMGNMRRQLEEARQELSIRERLIGELENKLAVAVGEKKASEDADGSRPPLEMADSIDEIADWKAKLEVEIENKLSRENQNRIAATNAAFDALRIKELEETVRELRQQLEHAAIPENIRHPNHAPPPAPQSNDTPQQTGRNEEIAQLEKKIVNLLDRNQELESRLQKKDNQIDTLQQRVTQLTAEMDEKLDGIRAYSEKTEQYIREREREQSETYERLIETIRTEHKKEIERLKIQLQEVDFRDTLNAVATRNMTKSMEGKMVDTTNQRPPLPPRLAHNSQPQQQQQQQQRATFSYAYMAGSLDRHGKCTRTRHNSYDLECRLPDTSTNARVSEWVFNCDPNINDVDSAIWNAAGAGGGPVGVSMNQSNVGALEELSTILASKEELTRRMKGGSLERLPPAPRTPRVGKYVAEKLSSFVNSVADTTRRASSLTRKPPSGRNLGKRGETPC